MVYDRMYCLDTTYALFEVLNIFEREQKKDKKTKLLYFSRTNRRSTTNKPYCYGYCACYVCCIVVEKTFEAFLCENSPS